jgi:hypothetical protein
MPNESFGDKAGSVVNEGLKVLRDGLREAGRLINVTADATRLHIEKESRVITTHREFHRLGEEFYEAVKNNPGATSVALTESMRSMIQRVQAAEADIAKNNKVLDHMSVVRVSKPQTPVKKTHAKRVLKKRTAQKKGAQKLTKRHVQRSQRS